MTDSVMTAYICEEIQCLNLNDRGPYRWWHQGLFERIPVSLLKEVTTDNHFVLALGIPGAWNLVEHAEEFRDLPGDMRNVLSKVNLLSRLYAAFVYPRDTVMDALIKRLPEDSAERRVCTAYFKEAEYRHIRNALAHGNIDFRDESDEAILTDRDWTECIACRRLLLDSRIIVDVISSIFERVKGIR